MNPIFIQIEEDEIFNIVDHAIANAVNGTDQQIVFDGEDFHHEDIITKDFIRGYVINSSQYNNVDENMEGEAFHHWLANEYFIHLNAMQEYFYNKNIVMISKK